MHDFFLHAVLFIYLLVCVHQFGTYMTGMTHGIVSEFLVKAMHFVPLHWVRRVAAAVFLVLGVLVLAGVGLA